jgi:hypothetical protein
VRLAFFLGCSALIMACSLAYPTRELEEDASAPADSGKLDTAKPDVERCVTNGRYCGNDKVMGDPNNLYVCLADGGAKLLQRCEAGCLVAPPGKDDYCL